MSLLKLVSDEYAKTQDKNKFFRELADLFGIEKSEINPLSSHCLEVFEMPKEKICNDFRLQRKWVMCNAWRMLESKESKEKVESFGDAIRKSWAELKLMCGID